MTTESPSRKSEDVMEIARWWAEHPYEGKTIRSDAHAMGKELVRLASTVSETGDRHPLAVRVSQFDAAIQRIGNHVGACCGGVDTEKEIDQDTGHPYGPGGHTAKAIIAAIDAHANEMWQNYVKACETIAQLRGPARNWERLKEIGAASGIAALLIGCDSTSASLESALEIAAERYANLQEREVK
jgi:hypothetical protein